MATGVNFMIFEKRFFSEFNDVSHVIIVYITTLKKNVKFNSKINKRSYRLRLFLLNLSNRLLEFFEICYGVKGI
jgi:hypothetical protein